jgi:hypothetical protein
MALIYFDLRTTDLCSEWEAKKYTVPLILGEYG